MSTGVATRESTVPHIIDKPHIEVEAILIPRDQFPACALIDWVSAVGPEMSLETWWWPCALSPAPSIEI